MSEWVSYWQALPMIGLGSDKNIMLAKWTCSFVTKKHLSVLWSDPKILPRFSEQWHSTPNRFYRRRIQPWKPRTDALCWWNPPSSCSQSCSQMRQRSSRLLTAALHSLSGSSEYLQFNFLPYIMEDGVLKRQIKPQKWMLWFMFPVLWLKYQEKLWGGCASTCVSAL